MKYYLITVSVWEQEGDDNDPHTERTLITGEVIKAPCISKAMALSTFMRIVAFLNFIRSGF